MTDNEPMVLYTATYDSVSAAMTDLDAIEQLHKDESPQESGTRARCSRPPTIRQLASVPGSDRVRFAIGEPALGVTGFRRTHQQALSAQAVALAAGPSSQLVTSFDEVAPLALMSGSIELLQAWVIETLGDLADDDEHNARLRDTLRVFLQENGSYKATAERLVLHKNTVQYRVRKAEEGLRRPISQDRLRIELALLAGQWLGAAVLRPAGGPE